MMPEDKIHTSELFISCNVLLLFSKYLNLILKNLCLNLNLLNIVILLILFLFINSLSIIFFFIKFVLSLVPK